MAAILLNNPGVVPPAEGATYPILWLSHFRVEARDPNAPVSIHGKIDKARVIGVDETGKQRLELMPNGSIDINLNDFYNTATPEQLAVAQSLLEMIQPIADPAPA